MKKKPIFLFALILAFSLLISCGGKTKSKDDNAGGSGFKDAEQSLEKAVESLNSDGSYTVKAGNRYIGINYLFEDGEYWELMLICDGDKVVDCARNSALERFMYKEEYIGSTYEQAFLDFYNLNRPVEDHGALSKISLIIMKNDKADKYEKVLERIKEKIDANALTGITEDDEWHFNEVIKNFTIDYVARMEDDEKRKAEEAENEARIEAERLAEEEKRRAEEEKRLLEEELLNSPVTDNKELKERYEKGVRSFTLASEITLNLEEWTPVDVLIDCAGKAVTISGCFDRELTQDDSGRCIELRNASSVDLSGFTVADGCFKNENWLPDETRENGAMGISVVNIINTSYKNVSFPSWVKNRDTINDLDLSIFEGYFWYEINDDGDEESISYIGPRATYEVRNEKEKAVVMEILTKGDAYDFLGEEFRGEYDIWTDITVDVGSITLPNQDYMGIRLRPGAKLTVEGTITITGGTLNFQISEGNQLDLTGLTLIKKHPSPDMVKVRFERNLKVNEELLKAKAGNGKASYVLGEISFDISIW
ncbi:MAG: hypothetical protein K6G72_00620 [Lachnospiraceae bacterium]|nr:hypothetical protein [Lachnospiraceae bacterium]